MVKVSLKDGAGKELLPTPDGGQVGPGPGNMFRPFDASKIRHVIVTVGCSGESSSWTIIPKAGTPALFAVEQLWRGKGVYPNNWNRTHRMRTQSEWHSQELNDGISPSSNR